MSERELPTEEAYVAAWLRAHCDCPVCTRWREQSAALLALDVKAGEGGEG